MSAAYATEAERLAARRATYRRYAEKRCKSAAYKEAQKSRHQKWYAANKGNPDRNARKAAQMRAYAKAPETRARHKARWQVQRAIEAGRLVKAPCEVCGSSKVQAHHDDYAEPLDVRWLCRKHHDEHHAKATGAA